MNRDESIKMDTRKYGGRPFQEEEAILLGRTEVANIIADIREAALIWLGQKIT